MNDSLHINAPCAWYCYQLPMYSSSRKAWIRSLGGHKLPCCRPLPTGSYPGWRTARLSPYSPYILIKQTIKEKQSSREPLSTPSMPRPAPQARPTCRDASNLCHHLSSTSLSATLQSSRRSRPKLPSNIQTNDTYPNNNHSTLACAVQWSSAQNAPELETHERVVRLLSSRVSFPPLSPPFQTCSFKR